MSGGVRGYKKQQRSLPLFNQSSHCVLSHSSPPALSGTRATASTVQAPYPQSGAAVSTPPGAPRSGA